MAHSLDLDALTMWRKKAGLSIVGLARAAGLPEATVRAAFAGRSVSDATLAALTKAQSEIRENPLVKVVSPDEMLAQDAAGIVKMDREERYRQVVVKADETLGQARLREALAATQTPAREEAFLIRKGEELESLATTIAKDTGATPEDVVSQLLAADPSRMEAYDALGRHRLDQQIQADALASARLHEAQEQGAKEGRVELEKAAPQQVTAKPAQDITDLAAGNTGGSDQNAEVRAAMVWSQREGLLFDSMIELIRAFRKAGSPASPDRVAPVRKQEEPVQTNPNGPRGPEADQTEPVILQKDDSGVIWRLVERTADGDERWVRA